MCRILPIVNKIAQLRSESMEKQKSDPSEPAWCGLTVRRRHGRRKVRVSARASVDIYFFAHPPDFIPLEDWDSDRNPSKLNKDGSLFHMLSTSARRAAIVKKLHIHFSDGDYWRGATVTTAVNDIMVQVSDTLKKLPNLVDLRIAYDWLGGPSGGRLSETIGFVFI